MHSNIEFLDKSFYYQRRGLVVTIYDVAGYKQGWILLVGPFIAIMKIKISKLMETPKYLTIVDIFGREFIIQ